MTQFIFDTDMKLRVATEHIIVEPTPRRSYCRHKHSTSARLDAGKPASSSAADASRERRLVAMHLQEIEGNPLDAGQIAMFEMFEREGWSQERRLEHLRARAARVASG